ncbi:MAG TPA: methyltransferase domain-containing protein [Flavobacterium sp.]|nr:methyltransferase domain-containing protein [Flavobacterium sp.]HPJ10808.1 methyltransferase domain-containing protein [Flavobacterium sp.]
MRIDTKHRTDLPEIMDDFSMNGSDLRMALDKIARINQLLGGNKLTLQGVKDLIAPIDVTQKLTIVDLGCGNGDMLRLIADWAESNRRQLELIGVDANAHTIEYARELSLHYPNISYHCTDIFSKTIAASAYDIALFTLTLHHFKNEEIAQLLRTFKQNTRIGVVVNDLQRSSVAYRLFQALCFVFRLNAISRNDGLISILRGFKRNELVSLSEKLNYKKYSIQWKWAFRYQWILSKI